jgi:hypothetical protein
MLEPGTYSAEWFSIDGRATVQWEETTVESSTRTRFVPPEAPPSCT